jgi:two-component system chemotaxis response regulator CheB
LVVDDSAVVREVMTGVLSQEPGMRVAAAADPLIAMQKMRHHAPMSLSRSGNATDGRPHLLHKIMTEDPIR